MAYEELKNAIKQVIKQNGNQEITGSTMQNTLLSMVNNIPEVVQTIGESVYSVMSQKAVNNEIDDVNARVEAESTVFHMNIGGYIRLTDGNVTNTPWSGYSDFINIENVLEITGGNLTSTGASVAFYDENKKYLKDISVAGTGSGNQLVTITDDIRSKAKYARVSFYASTESISKELRVLYVNKYVNNPRNAGVKVDNVSVYIPKNYNNLGIIDYQLPIADINHIAIYGQSLSTGQQGCPVISTENFRGNLMVGQYEWLGGEGSNNKSGLNPLKASSIKGDGYIPTGISDQTNGETPALTFTNAAKALFDSYVAHIVDRKFLDTSSGTGGNSIETLSKNYPPTKGALYKNFANALSTVKSLVNRENKSVVCTALVWMQGEWNESQHENKGWTGNSPATADTDDYQKMLLGGQTSDGVHHNGLINDMIEDVMTTYGQENMPIVLGTTIGRNFHRFFENPIDMALLRASNASKGKFVLVTPDYRVTDRNGHLDANGYRWCGEFLAKVWYKRVILKQDWHPLQPVKITKCDNTSILIKFNVPEPPLEFDTWQVKQGSNYGFSIRNDGTAVTIKSVEIYSPTEVMIKTNLELTGTVEIAYATAGNTYGNLRDSDKWIAFGKYTDLDSLVENPAGVSYRPSFEPTDKDGNNIYGKKYPMQNFCVPFYYKLDKKTVIEINF